MGDRKSFIVYTDWEDKLSDLSDDDFGKLFRAIFRYLDTGQTPDSTQLVNLAFKFIKGILDADKEKYEARCIRNSDNVKKRWKRDGCDEVLNADQNIRNDTTDIPEDATHIPNNTTGIRNDTTDIPDGYQTPVITDNCKLITDNCVSTDVDTTCCTEPKSGSVQKQTEKSAEEAVFKLPLNDGTEYGITQAQIDRWAELYPRVDIMQALRGMLGWTEANPANRKTRRGITRFINGWLAKDQDRGRNQRTANSQNSPNVPLEDWEKQWLADLDRRTGKGEEI